ncbi:MAG: hypothetical protein IKL85_03660 [Lentisphaeria bacterium]|nr:hypothetical protein [Lentisphaeria bacterium]
MSPSKKTSAKTKTAAKKSAPAAKESEAKKTVAKKAPAKKTAAKKAASEVYPGETAPERVIKADLKVVKGERSDIWRDCVGAGRIGEGLRDTWRKQLAKCKKELGFRYLRAHGLFHDEMRVYSEDMRGIPCTISCTSTMCSISCSPSASSRSSSSASCRKNSRPARPRSSGGRPT